MHSGTADILGHHTVIDRLWDALARGVLHHAYLFEGPSGVGKRMVALRLAMAANCTGTESGDRPPCGRCPPCKQIAAGSHPDVIVLAPDPKRATAIIPVDAVREVVRVAGYHRYNSKRRFILIDPAEALQPAAANALLKTLEEPPEGTGFILIATHASALLPTIVSRCQRVRFSAVPEADITQWLTTQRKDQPELAARLSLGCPGKALALAEGRLASRADMRQSLVHALHGGSSSIFDWSAKLTKGSRQEWSARVEALMALIEDLLRDVVVLGSGSSAPLLNVDNRPLVEKWQAALWPRGVGACQAAIAEAREEMLVNVQGKLVLDAMLLRIRHELGARA